MSAITPAMQALYLGDVEKGEKLLSPEPSTFEAAAFGRSERLSEILAAQPMEVQARAADDFTPLHLAAFFGQLDSVRVLVEAGADLEAEATNTFVRQVRPLHSAVAGRSVECCRLLIAAGADVNATQGDGFTPLMEAAQVGDAVLAKLLLDFGADIKAHKADGTTAEVLARDGGHEEVLDLLSTTND
jgi:ankyrin repeat protein